MDFLKLESVVQSQLNEYNIAFIPVYDGNNYVLTKGKNNTVIASKKYTGPTFQENNLFEILNKIHFYENLV